MKHSDFKINSYFFMSGVGWLCTDIGTRTVVGIRITEKIAKDPSWLNGPPYAVQEVVLDENDFEACESDNVGKM